MNERALIAAFRKSSSAQLSRAQGDSSSFQIRITSIEVKATTNYNHTLFKIEHKELLVRTSKSDFQVVSITVYLAYVNPTKHIHIKR